MSQLVTRSQGEKLIEDTLLSPKMHIQLGMGAPRDVDPERIARIVLTCVRESKALATCAPESVIGAAMICAQTGLEPGPMGHAAIVPYNGKAQFQAMYKGLLHLCYRSEQVTAPSTGVVYSADEFDYSEGTDAFVRHKKFLGKDRGERIAVYASIGLKSGGHIVRVMPIHEIDRIRDQYSKTKQDRSAWTTEYDEMAMKTALKRVAKIAPCSPEAKIAITMDDLAEVGKPQPTGVTEKDISNLGTDERPPPDTKPADYCNKDLGNGIACGLKPGHKGACAD